MVAAAPPSFAIRAWWLAPSMVRWTLSVDSAASLLCAAVNVALLPTPAVRTVNGLFAKSLSEAACWADAPPFAYSSIVLRRFSEVARLARTSSRDRGGRVPKAVRA